MIVYIQQFNQRMIVLLCYVPCFDATHQQADDRVGHTSLDVSDAALWKPMDSSRLIPAGQIENELLTWPFMHVGIDLPDVTVRTVSKHWDMGVLNMTGLSYWCSGVRTNSRIFGIIFLVRIVPETFICSCRISLARACRATLLSVAACSCLCNCVCLLSAYSYRWQGYDLLFIALHRWMLLNVYIRWWQQYQYRSIVYCQLLSVYATVLNVNARWV